MLMLVKRKLEWLLLISDQLGFRAKTITKDKKGHFIIKKKGWINQEDITFLNIHAPNHSTSKYMKQKVTELQGEIDKSTIITRNLKTTL